MTPARYILLVLLVSFFATIGVAQRARVVHLGLRIGYLQGEKQLLAEQNRLLLCEISTLRDPDRIAGVVKSMNIALLGPVELTKASDDDASPTTTTVRRTRPGGR